MWVARDKDNRLYMYRGKPVKSRNQWLNTCAEMFTILPTTLLPKVTWEDDEPVEVDIVPKQKALKQ